MQESYDERFLKRLAERIAIRSLSADEFVERHASGTLRKNKRLGMAWKQQYLEERVAFEFGWGFECLPYSRVTAGTAITEGEQQSLTEVGWHADRLITLSLFPDDHYTVKYLIVEYAEGVRREGIGVLVESNAPFIPCGSVVFAIVAHYDTAAKTWLPAQNPC